MLDKPPTTDLRSVPETCQGAFKANLPASLPPSSLLGLPEKPDFLRVGFPASWFPWFKTHEAKRVLLLLRRRAAQGRAHHIPHLWVPMPGEPPRELTRS